MIMNKSEGYGKSCGVFKSRQILFRLKLLMERYLGIRMQKDSKSDVEIGDDIRQLITHTEASNIFAFLQCNSNVHRDWNLIMHFPPRMYFH